MSTDLASGGESLSIRRGELVALVIAAAGFRLLLLAFLPRVIFGDEAAYLLLGREFWLAGAVPTTHPPLLPLLAGGVWRLTGSPELGTGLWFVLCGALLVFTVVRFAAALGGRRVALLAGALVVVYPALSTGPLFWASMTEPLFICLVYAGMEAACRGARSERLLLVATAGGLFSLAYLTRPEGGLWMVAAVVALVGDRLLRCLPMARVAVHVGALVLAFVLVALPYLVSVRVSTGRWTLSGKLVATWEFADAVMRQDHQLADQALSGLDSEGKPRYSATSGKGFIEILLTNPQQVVHRIAGNSARLARKAFTQQILPPAFAILAAIAIVARRRSRKRFADDLWLAGCVVPVSAFVMFQIEARFYSPAAPALLIWAAAGFEELDRRLAARNRSVQRTVVVALVAAAIAASLVYGHGPALAERREVVYPSRRDAGTWIRGNTPPDALVMAQDDTYGVYSDRPFLASPHVPYPEWIRYIQAHASYVVVEGYEVRTFRPYLAFLLDPQRTPPELEAVYRLSDTRNEVVVFRVRPGAS